LTQSIRSFILGLVNPDVALRLDRQICFLLYGASRAVTQLYQPLLAPLGITYPQYLVMLVLWEEGVASVGRLSDRLYLDSGTLTPLLKRLEAAGLVRRLRSQSDERVVDIHLTAAGKRLKQSAARVPEALMCRVGLASHELVRVRRELVRLFDVTRGQLHKKEKAS
jgi:DNA-binding MarR family transcriptional regulator